jgi:hypothetical protein
MKSKKISISRHQNAAQDHKINIAGFFPNVVELKYLGNIVTNPNLTPKEKKNKRN